jgi:hypothetical protein
MLLLNRSHPEFSFTGRFGMLVLEGTGMIFENIQFGPTIDLEN